MQRTRSPCTAGETLGPEQIVEKTISRNGENRSVGGEAAAEWARRGCEEAGNGPLCCKSLDDGDSNFGDLPKKEFGRRKVGKEKLAPVWRQKARREDGARGEAAERLKDARGEAAERLKRCSRRSRREAGRCSRRSRRQLKDARGEAAERLKDARGEAAERKVPTSGEARRHWSTSDWTCSCGVAEPGKCGQHLGAEICGNTGKAATPMRARQGKSDGGGAGGRRLGGRRGVDQSRMTATGAKTVYPLRPRPPAIRHRIPHRGLWFVRHPAWSHRPPGQWEKCDGTGPCRTGRSQWRSC